MNKRIIRLLLIEDNTADALLIQELLYETQSTDWHLPTFEVEHVVRLEQALERLDERTFDVVLSDLKLPDSGADATIPRLRRQIPHLPLVVLTNRADETLAQLSVRAGVQDYLYKTEVTGSLLARTLLYAIERQQIHENLEQRVQERTAKLSEINARLQEEIGERKRMEQALRQSEERYRSLFEDSPIAVCEEDFSEVKGYLDELQAEGVEDLKGYFEAHMEAVEHSVKLIKVLDVNDAALTLYGAASKEELLCGLDAFFAVDGYPAFIEELVGIAQGETYVEVHSVNRTLGGEKKHLIVTWRVVPGYEESLARCIVLVRDVTERQRTEELLLKAFDTEHVALAISRRRDGMYLAANQGFFKVTGYTREEIVGHTSGELNFLSPAQRHTLMDNVDEEGRLHNQELTFPTKSGELRTILFSIGPITIDNESCLLATMVDITDRKQIEGALRASEEQFRTLARLAPTGIYLTDLEGNCQYANERWLEMAGLTLEEALGEGWISGLHPENGMRIQDRWQEFVTSQGRWEQEYRFQNRDGETIWIYGLAAPRRDDKGEVVGYVGINLDITERKEAEEQIEHYAAELQRSNQELEQFGYIVSHDLQEPLRMVRGYLELLQLAYRQTPNERLEEYIDYAMDGAKRLQEMIKALLDLSRVETRGREFKATDVAVLLKRLLTGLGRLIADTNAEVSHGPLPTVMADEVQLAEVFQNLIVNAIKFRQEGERPRVEISAEGDEKTWTFCVADDGIGIDPRQSDRLFQIFQRLHTREEYPGTGIGLALCRRIVERHGGRIWVESQPGEGAAFYFTLPKVDGNAEGPTPNY
jgi:PAS domain S-box-containing protein